jgi:hypothetical protein
MQNIVLGGLKLATAEMGIGLDPGDGIAAPIEMRAVLDDGEVDGDKHALSVAKSIPSPLSYLRVRTAAPKAEVRKRRDPKSPTQEPSNQGLTREMCIEYEGLGHGSKLGSRVRPLHGLSDLTCAQAIIGLEQGLPFRVGGNLRDLGDGPPPSLQGRQAT